MQTPIEQLAARLTRPHPQNPEDPAQSGAKPGAAISDPLPRYYTKLKIVSNAQGESILFGLDDNYKRLTIWLPTATAGEWTVYEPQLNGLPFVKDFDLLSNHLQGRKDDTLDLAVIAYNGDSKSQSMYFPALPFSIRLEDWQAYFAKPINLTPLQSPLNSSIRLGLLPKARRSVFLNSFWPESPETSSATRYDVDVDGQFVKYPFNLGPEWNGVLTFPMFEPCVAARQPESFTFDDGLVGSYRASEFGVVKVMLPKAPLGDAWELTPLPPMMGFSHWLPVTNISTFLRPDTGESIITYVMGANTGSPLNKAVWVMDNDTLYHSNRGCWWLAAPQDEQFPPSYFNMVRALPVWMQDDQPLTWVWLQVGNRRDSSGYTTGVIASRSTGFRNEGATNEWLAMPGTRFEASLAASSTVPGQTVARVFMADSSQFSLKTSSLTLATLDNASGQWQYQDVTMPPLPAGK